VNNRILVGNPAVNIFLLLSSSATVTSSVEHTSAYIICTPRLLNTVYYRLSSLQAGADTGGDRVVTSHPLPETEKIILQRISHLGIHC